MSNNEGQTNPFLVKQELIRVRGVLASLRYMGGINNRAVGAAADTTLAAHVASLEALETDLGPRRSHAATGGSTGDPSEV